MFAKVDAWLLSHCKLCFALILPRVCGGSNYLRLASSNLLNCVGNFLTVPNVSTWLHRCDRLIPTNKTYAVNHSLSVRHIKR